MAVRNTFMVKNEANIPFYFAPATHSTGNYFRVDTDSMTTGLLTVQSNSETTEAKGMDSYYNSVIILIDSKYADYDISNFKISFADNAYSSSFSDAIIATDVTLTTGSSIDISKYKVIQFGNYNYFGNTTSRNRFVTIQGTFTDKTPPAPTYTKLTQNLTNCTLTSIGDGQGGTYTADTIPVGDSVYFTVKLNDGYKWDFNNLPNVTDGNGTVLATADAPSTASASYIEFRVPEVTDAITLNATAISDSIPVTANNLTFCTATPLPTELQRGDSLTVTYTANDGYYFKETPYIRYYDTVGYTDIKATMSSDNTIGTATISGDITGNKEIPLTSISIRGVAELKPSIPTVSNSLIKAYTITNEGLQQLATKRWYESTSEGAQIVDLANYITSLKKFYFDVPSSLDTTLVLYTFNTEIPCKVVSGDTVTLDCGEIAIESTNNNNNDYTNTNVQLMLPFVGFVTLDSNLCVGQTIHLTYDVSTITGDFVAKISINDIIVYEFNGNMAEDVPYILNNIQWQLQGSIGFNSSSLYGLTPYVLIQYHDNYNDENILADNKRCILNTLTGLNYVDDVIIDDSSIDDDTKTLIYNLLSKGVIF